MGWLSLILIVRCHSHTFMRIVTNYDECKAALAEVMAINESLNTMNQNLVEFQAKLFMLVQEKGSVSRDDYTRLAIERRVAEVSPPERPLFRVQ